MRSHVQAFALLFAISSLATIGGCGGVSDGPEVLVPVSGSVLIENQPAPGVAVTFIPADGTGGIGAAGATDAEGKFSLLHNSGGEGIEPGTYKVIFSRWRMPNGDPVPPGQSAADVNAVDTIPALYRDPQRTIFTEVIPAEGKQDLKFQL